MALIVRNTRGQFTKILFPLTDIVFNKFSTKIIKQAQQNLKNKKKGNGKLYKSLRADVLQKKNDFILRFFSTDYGDFVDQGVSGTKRKISGTKYKYTNKIPPPTILGNWASKKGLRGRDKKGRFITKKSLGFAIAYSIFYKGLDRTLFYTDAFKKFYNSKFINDVETAFAEDMENIIANELQSEFDKT